MYYAWIKQVLLFSLPSSSHFFTDTHHLTQYQHVLLNVDVGEMKDKHTEERETEI